MRRFGPQILVILLSLLVFLIIVAGASNSQFWLGFLAIILFVVMAVVVAAKV